MGSGRFSPDDWDKYATSRSYATKPAAEIFATRLEPSLDPKGVTREARDSDDNPNSTPLIVCLDVSGSMHSVLEVMARKGLPLVMTEVYNRKPIHDPAMCAMAIDDAEVGNEVPLQVTQFESDLRIAEQLEKIYLEGGGGGNSYESYIFSWYFAARHVVSDAWEKRQKKGYLFTIGDERPTPYLRAEDILRVCGDVVQDKIMVQDLLTEVTRQWEVFHLMVRDTANGQSDEATITKQWTDLLGQRAISLSDHTKVAEVIVSTLQIVEGEDHSKVADSWDGTTSLVVAEATRGLTKRDAGGALVNV
jgi:hypothetical protein